MSAHSGGFPAQTARSSVRVPQDVCCYQHLASRLSAVACSDVTISYCIESGAMPAADYMLKMGVAHAGGFLEASTISLLGHLSYIV
jgi:hypothetical protein